MMCGAAMVTGTFEKLVFEKTTTDIVDARGYWLVEKKMCFPCMRLYTSELRAIHVLDAKLSRRIPS
jgi:hypothetical protein